MRSMSKLANEGQFVNEAICRFVIKEGGLSVFLLSEGRSSP